MRIRGFLYFPGKSAFEVKKVFSNVRMEGVEILLFDKLFLYGEDRMAPGIFIDGEIEPTNKKPNIISTLRKKMGFNDVKNYDASAGNEDYVAYVKEGRKEGNYVQVHLLPPFDFDKAKQVAREIGQVIVASDIFIRSVNNKEGAPRLGVDLITRMPLEKVKERIQIIPSPPRESGKVILIEGLQPLTKKS